jgi:ComF family protein
MEIRVREGEVCFHCGDTLDQPGEHCRVCRLAPPPFERAVAYGPYEGRMRDALHAFKYDGMRPAARGLGRMLAAAIAQLAGEAPAELLVVPVPLHRLKYAARGFNQARALAAEALAELRRSHPEWKLALAPDTLLRQRATLTQAGLTPRQRRANLRGAFRVADEASIHDRHILLVDDILTTGATARAASSALLRAGAASVWVATLARAARTQRGNEKLLAAWRGQRKNNERHNKDARVSETQGMYEAADPSSF